MAESIRTVSIWRKIALTCGHWPGIGPVLIAAAMLRLGSIALIRSYLHPVTWEFGPLVASINAGLGYTIVLRNGMRVPSAYMPPAYPYLLAWILRLGGDRPATYLLIEIAQAALGVLLVYVVYCLASILLGQRGAIAAACLTAIFPSQVYMCNEFHPISMYIVIQCAAVLFLVRYLEVSTSWTNVILASLCMGLLLLFRAEAIALVFLYAAILMLRGGRRAVGPAIVFMLIAVACLAPWTVRNYRAFGRFVPVATLSGYNLWVGNNALATGSQHSTRVDMNAPELRSVLDKLPLDRSYEVERSNALKRLAIEFAEKHPTQEAVLLLRKLFLFFVFDPEHEKGRNPAYWLPSVLLTFFALYGAMLRGKELLHKDLLLTASVLFGVAVAVAAVLLPRYKIVIDPYIIILAANVFAVKGLGNLRGSEGQGT